MFPKENADKIELLPSQTQARERLEHLNFSPHAISASVLQTLTFECLQLMAIPIIVVIYIYVKYIGQNDIDTHNEYKLHF